MNLTKQSKRLNVILPIKMQAILIQRKKDWNIFEKLQGIIIRSFAHWHDGVNTVKRVRNTFSIWRKETMSKNMCENLRLMVRSLLIRLGNEQATGIFLNSLNIPRLTDEQKLSCEGSIMHQSIETAAPRSTGRSGEFNIYPVLKGGLFPRPRGQETC